MLGSFPCELLKETPKCGFSISHMSAGPSRLQSFNFALKFLHPKHGARHRWLTTVFLATWEAEIRRISVQG
jgi:DNA-binding transcriptional regulator GbsR (MarR family)